jgi:hypothetical protein
MQRRNLLKAGAASALVALARPIAGWAQHLAATDAPSFKTDDARWQRAYDKALAILGANVQVMPRVPLPILIEGSSYAGIWQECGPHESLVYRHFRPDVARNSHLTFFLLQREDGQLPANNKRTEAGYGQIQMVVPIAATAWELARATGDSDLLAKAYASCARWDTWLTNFRNTRRTGLVEGFCTYDTGMDNSPRWAGKRAQCPNKDARRCPADPSLPRLCPDLSATVYGGRVALASMAEALGKQVESEQWRERAATLRSLIREKLYVPEDAAFYDLDAQSRFVKVRCDILSRICGEHVLDAKSFDHLWQQQLGNPKAFWAPFPFPSAALDEPTFVRPIPRNSWGGASQALTALRACRWMDHYGKHAEFAHLMRQWCETMQNDISFRQQLDPLSGEFTPGDEPNYSPASLLMYEFTWRLAGVYEEGDELLWNVRPGSAAARNASFRLKVGSKSAEMLYDAQGADLTLGGRKLGRVNGLARVATDKDGKLLYALGVEGTTQKVELRPTGRPPRHLTLQPDAREILT